MEAVPRLLDDPGRDGVDQLPIEEHHLEEHDEHFDQGDLDDELDLPLLDRLDQRLDAGEAAHDQQEQEAPEDHRGRPRHPVGAGEVGQHLRQGRH